MSKLHCVAYLLAMVGAINWGLVGLGDWNLVEMLLGGWPMVMKVVYVLVGASAVYLVVTHKKDCKACEVKPVGQ